MMKSSLFTVASVILMLNLSACSNSDSPSTKAVPKEPGLEDVLNQKKDKDTTSCEFNAETGDTADLNILRTPQVTVANFQKKYDRNWLKAVSATSGLETARVVENAGAQLFKVSTTTNGCSFYRFLNPAPSDLRKMWDDSAGGAAGAGSVLGIYLPVSSKYPSTQTKPAIMVREVTDRYTLVHEFMHHNFSTHTLNQSGISDDQLKSQIESLIEKITLQQKTYQTDRSLENAKQMASSLIQFGNAFDQLMVRYTFEEMTIETVLGHEYENGNLKHVSEMSYINGGRYIGANNDRYKSLSNSILESADQISNTVLIDHRFLIADAKASLQRQISARKSEAQNLDSASAARRNKLYNRRSIGLGDRDQMAILPHAGCKHSDGMMNDLDQMAERLKERTAN